MEIVYLELFVVISVIAIMWAFKRPVVRIVGRVPRYMTEGAAGFDLHANPERPIRISPGSVHAVPTGLRVAVPRGYELQVRPRSGLAKRLITVANAPGTVDSDYRGEIFVLLVNHGESVFEVRRGDRIAQGVVAPCVRVELQAVQSLDETKRGTFGFGSTGI